MASPFEITATPEFERIFNLPRRKWEERALAHDLCARMTRAFSIRGNPYELRPIQAAALADGHDLRGLLAPMSVGTGKTLVSYLLPAIIPGIQRPLLILPAALEKKTWREFKILQKHWICHPDFMTEKKFKECVITYQALSRENGKKELQDRRPDILICDEAHKIANRDASCTKSVSRFMVANPETIFCAMSGTITKRSIADYWHLIFWALRHNMPLPRSEAEMLKWSEALDERKIEAVSRIGAGALMHFVAKEDLPQAAERTVPVGRTQQMPEFYFENQLAAVRKGYQRRLQESPGVVSSTEQSVACSLTFRRLQVDLSPQVLEHFKALRTRPATSPNGDILTTPMEVWRVAREIACDFYYEWQPPPPSDWMGARSTWNWFCREICYQDGSLHAQYAHLHLDSPMQVARAVTGASLVEYETDEETLQAMALDAGYNLNTLPEGVSLAELPDPRTGRMLGEGVPAKTKTITHPPTITDENIVKAYHAWAAVRGSYKINTVPRWIDDTMQKFCVNWSKQNGPAIIWTEHRAFGIRLAQLLGTGFCSNGGLDANGRMIEDYTAKETVVASVAANSEGRNLQNWNNNLIVTVMPTGRVIEQLAGRTHRQGQTADNVNFDWIAACPEQDQGFSQMMADARYIQDTTGAVQKILFADHI